MSNALSNAFSRLRKVTAIEPPRVLIYGPRGVGKTTIATEFPDAVFIQAEDGTPNGVEINTFGHIENYSEVVEILNDLYAEDHGYKTIVIDTATAMHALICAEGLIRYNAENRTHHRSLDEIDWGKGASVAMKVWDEFIYALDLLRNKRRMMIVILGHSVVTEFKDPMTAAYHRYDLELPASDKPSTNIRGRVLRDMDLVLFMNTDVGIKQDDRNGVSAKNDKSTARVRATSNKVVLGYATRHPAYEAKNRYDMPDQIRLDRGRGYSELSKFFPVKNGATIAAEQKEAA